MLNNFSYRDRDLMASEILCILSLAHIFYCSKLIFLIGFMRVLHGPRNEQAEIP